jgi:hypothetical protein
MNKIRIIAVLFLLTSVIACSTSQAKNSPKQTTKKADTTELDSNAVQSSTPKADSVVQKAVVGTFVKTNEEGDYWFFYISDKKGKEIKFVYNSEDILKAKTSYQGKVVKVKYFDKEFEEAGSGDKFTEKYLQSVEIQK